MRTKAESFDSVSIRLGRKVTAVAQGGQGVRLILAGPSGDEAIEARYVVGCDGAGSTIRKLAG